MKKVTLVRLPFSKILRSVRNYIFLVVSFAVVSALAESTLAVVSTVVTVAVESTLVESVVEVVLLPEQAAKDNATTAAKANFTMFFILIFFKVLKVTTC
jgi:hypothetical protein